MKPLVSILIPAYNVEMWLAQTLESAVNQTYENIEIIVLDDGSKDRTCDVAKKYESTRVKLLRQENMGVCRTRNNLMKQAQGEFLQFLDADDVLHPEKIDAQIRASEKTEPQKTFFTASFGTFFHDINKARFNPNSLWQDLNPVDWMIFKFTEILWMNPTTWLIPRTLAEKGGVWNDKIARSGDDDGEYMCRIIKNADLVKFVEESKCFYRIGNFGSLNWNSRKALEELYLSLRLSTEHLRAIEDSERTRYACLNYIQVWFDYFDDPGEPARKKMQEYARELGGELVEPRLKAKYIPFQLILGKKFARKMHNFLPKIKLRISSKLEAWQ